MIINKTECKTHTAKWILRMMDILIFATLIFTSPGQAQTPVTLSESLQILAKGGGVACFTQAGDVDAVMALARNPRWVVHVLLTDSAQVQSARKSAADAGLLGRALFVEEGTPERLPHADHLLDLLVTGPETPEAEALRVISPIRGKAYIGERLLTKPELPGSDWWTHRVHKPDNNSATLDTAFQLPFMMQYTAMPFYSSFHGSQLVSGALRVEFYDWVARYSGHAGTAAMAGQMVARNLYNGQILWRQEMPRYIKPDAQISALYGDRIFLASGLPNLVKVYDVESGQELPDIEPLPDDARQVTWLGIENDRLHLLLADPDWPRIPSRGGPGPHALLWDLQRRERVPGTYDPNASLQRPETIITSSIVCWDLTKGRILWKHDEPAAIDFRHVAMRDGRTFFFSQEGRLTCLDADGSMVWENRDRAWIDSQSRFPNIQNGNIRNSSAMIAGPTVLLLGNVCGTKSGKERGLVFDLADGRLLREGVGVGDRGFEPTWTAFSEDGTLWQNRQAIDPLTGESLDTTQPTQGRYGHCGYRAWIPAVGMVGHDSFMFKNPCAIPPIVAGGVLTYFPSVCNCTGPERGAGAYMAGGAVLERAEQRPAHPLIKGPAFDRKTKSIVDTAHPHDWPQHRGDAQRRGGSNLQAPATPVLQSVCPLATPLIVPPGHSAYRWEWLERPTPPVTAGGLAFHGTSTGLVRAVRIADGAEAWSYWTGGPILTAPVVLNGCLYAGSGDGWLYCLDAANGDLVWRWRGAPTQRHIMVYDKLMSSWPVISVVTDGTSIFGSAGRFEANGGVLFAVEPSTGSPQWTSWHRNEEALMDSAAIHTRNGMAGSLALLESDLSVDAFISIPGTYDARSGNGPGAGTGPGTFLILPEPSGQDTIVIDGQTVLRGGSNLFENPDIRWYKYDGNYRSYQAGGSTALNRPMFRNSVLIPQSIITPSLQGDDIALIGGGRGKGYSWTQGISVWRIRDLMDRELASHGSGLDTQQARWALPDLEVNAVVLCADAVLAVVAVVIPPQERLQKPEFTAWKLNAYAREDGRELWSVDLPGEPIYNGLAPAADGSWVLTLRDGSLAVVGQSQ